MLEISLRLWSNFKDIFNNIDKFAKFKIEMVVNECWMVPTKKIIILELIT